MSSPETFLAYGAIMLIIALVGVALDWFGKPLRHRKFIPKAYKFPDERHFRSQIFNAKPFPGNSRDAIPSGTLEFHTPVAQKESKQLDHSLNEETSRPPTQVPEVVVSEVTEKEQSVSASSENVLDNDLLGAENSDLSQYQGDDLGQEKTGLIRLQGWAPGGYIYNLKQDGTEPSPSTVRSRFWKNVGVASGSAVFGANNVDRLRSGKPPQRRNPRNGKIETMKVLLLSYEEGKGATPIPHWPTNAINPFGDK